MLLLAASLLLPFPSYLAVPPSPLTCAAPPRPASLLLPPACARRTATLSALSAETAADLADSPANASGKVLELAALWTYPIKSVRAVAQSTARLGTEGLDGDRRLLVASAANEALTQRQHPRLATVPAWPHGYARAYACM